MISTSTFISSSHDSLRVAVTRCYVNKHYIIIIIITIISILTHLLTRSSFKDTRLNSLRRWLLLLLSFGWWECDVVFIWFNPHKKELFSKWIYEKCFCLRRINLKSKWSSFNNRIPKSVKTVRQNYHFGNPRKTTKNLCGLVCFGFCFLHLKCNFVWDHDIFVFF